MLYAAERDIHQVYTRLDLPNTALDILMKAR